MKEKIKGRTVFLVVSLIIVLLSNSYLTHLIEQIERDTDFKVFDMLHHYTTNDVKVGLELLTQSMKQQYQLFLVIDLLFFITAVCVFQLLIHDVINEQVDFKMWHLVINGVAIIKMLTDVGENICVLILVNSTFNQKIASVLVRCSEIKMMSAAIWLMLVGIGVLLLVVNKIKVIRHRVK